MVRSVRFRLATAALCGAAGLAAVASAGAVKMPNPCALVPAATVAATLDLKGTTLTGKLSTRPDGPVKQTLCTYTHGTTSIQILVAPHEPVGGSGGPPGMKRLVPAGLGAGATDYYDTEPQYAFANVSFTRGGIDGGAFDHGSIPNARIVALARLVYKALA